MSTQPQQRTDSTSSGLLDRIRSNDALAWRRLASEYGPSVYRRARRAGLAPDDAADIVQDAFRSVAANIARFRRDRRLSFRAWLRTITNNKIIDHLRRTANEPRAVGGSDMQSQLEQIALQRPESADQPSDCRAEEVWCRALQIGRNTFEPTTWASFWGMVIEERSAAEIAHELNMTAAAVRQAKCRVLRQLRTQMGQLGDEDGGAAGS